MYLPETVCFNRVCLNLRGFFVSMPKVVCTQPVSLSFTHGMK